MRKFKKYIRKSKYYKKKRFSKKVKRFFKKGKLRFQSKSRSRSRFLTKKIKKVLMRNIETKRLYNTYSELSNVYPTGGVYTYPVYSTSTVIPFAFRY